MIYSFGRLFLKFSCNQQISYSFSYFLQILTSPDAVRRNRIKEMIVLEYPLIVKVFIVCKQFGSWKRSVFALRYLLVIKVRPTTLVSLWGCNQAAWYVCIITCSYPIYASNAWPRPQMFEATQNFYSHSLSKWIVQYGIAKRKGRTGSINRSSLGLIDLWWIAYSFTTLLTRFS